MHDATDSLHDVFRTWTVFSEHAPATKTSLASSLRYQMRGDCGAGWMDIHQIAHGIVVGRSDYTLATTRTLRSRFESPQDHVTIGVILSGHLGIAQAGRPTTRRISGGMVMLHPSHAGVQDFQCEQMAGVPFRGISLMLPRTLVQELADDEPDEHPAGWLGDADDTQVLDARLASHQHGLRTAHALMQASTRSVAGRLHAEALALEFVSLLARLPEPRPTGSRPLPYRQRVAVEETLTILHSEYADPHTIASLARRVRLNDCYLKSAFRSMTNKTIAHYLRELRMAKARELLEHGGMNVLQASQFVGYANPSQFSANFKAHHGIAPSRLKMP